MYVRNDINFIHSQINIKLLIILFLTICRSLLSLPEMNFVPLYFDKRHTSIFIQPQQIPCPTNVKLTKL